MQSKNDNDDVISLVKRDRNSLALLLTHQKAANAEIQLIISKQKERKYKSILE